MATDLSKRGFLKLFGQLAGGAVALSVLPDLGVAKDLVGLPVLWTPDPTPVLPIRTLDAGVLHISIARPGDPVPLMQFHLNAHAGVRWKAQPGEGIVMQDGSLTEIVVTTHTYSMTKQDTCQTTVSSAGRISMGWMKG